MNRRKFLLSSASFAGAASMIPFARLAHAAGPFTDYKALICLYMYGGNDGHNTIIPLGSEYAAYAAARGGLTMRNSIDAASDNPNDLIFKRPLNAITPSNVSGRSFALHTSLKKTAALFNAGKAAVVANVGPLIYPTSRAQFQSGTIALPPQLFSHSDQETYWQTLASDLSQTGWGGRMADLMEAAKVNGNSPMPVGTSLSGSTPWLRAQLAIPHVLNTYTPEPIRAYRSNDVFCTVCPKSQEVFENQIIKVRVNKFEEAYGDVMARAIDTQRFISGALEVVPTFRSDFPGTAADALPLSNPAKPGLAQVSGTVQNGLADQLRMVARVIAARSGLVATGGITPKRQIFFVSIGGFDSHGESYEDHAKLLGAIDGAVGAFQAKMDGLGLGANVTLFTASEFGRTLESNGGGSDHGWGNHHFVVGGAVQGGKFYGAPGSNGFPTVAVGTSTDVGEGRLLPTISADEYAATLGRWFGLSTDELKTVLPNLNNFQQFANFNVGFLG